MNEARQSQRFRIGRDVTIVVILLVAAGSAVAYLWGQQGDQAAAHLEAGRKYLRMNMGADAEREWKKAARLDPDNSAAWEHLAEYYARSEDFDSAIEPLSRLARLRSNSDQALDRLSFCASRLSDPASALREAEAAIRRDPEDVGAHAVAVKLLAKSDEEQKRLTYLRRLVELRPKAMGYRVLLARTLTNAHLYDEAAPYVERILAADPENVDAYGLRGRRRLDAGGSPKDLALAEADFKKALSLNPRGPMIHLQLGKLYARTDRPGLAVTHLESAARLLPDMPEIYFHLTGACLEAGMPGKAATARQRFAALRNQEDLKTVVEKRAAANPQDFDVHLQAGLLVLKNGELEKADYYLNRARTLRPADRQASEALSRLAAMTQGPQEARP